MRLLDTFPRYPSSTPPLLSPISSTRAERSRGGGEPVPCLLTPCRRPLCHPMRRAAPLLSRSSSADGTRVEFGLQAALAGGCQWCPGGTVMETTPPTAAADLRWNPDSI